MVSFSQMFFNNGSRKRRYRSFMTTKKLPRKKVCDRSVPQSVEKLHEMLQDPNLVQSINAQISIMADKCKNIISLLDVFKSRHPVTTKILNYLEDLQVVIAANKELQLEICHKYFRGFDLPCPTKTDILAQLVRQGQC
ncbi:uncharacterized protein V6R79_010273 [Siganus canaliculatus]